MSSLTPPIQLITKFPESMGSSELYSTSPNYSCFQFVTELKPLLNFCHLCHFCHMAEMCHLLQNSPQDDFKYILF